MNINHFTGVSIFIIALVIAGLVVASIAGMATWTVTTPVIIILVEIIRDAIKRR